MPKIAENHKLTASTDIATLSKDSEVGKVLQLRWKRIEKAGAKALVEFDKPLGDLLCKARAALEADQKQIPSKTLNHLNVGDIDRRRRSEAERLARDWDIEVPHLDGKTVGELAATGKWSSTTSLFNAVDKPAREAKAAERKAAKAAEQAEQEAAEVEEQNEVLIERGSVSLAEIAREALLQCDLHGNDVNALVNAIDAEILALLDEVHPQVTEAA